MLRSTIDYKNIQAVDDEQLLKISGLLQYVDIAIPSAMAYVRKIQGWKFQQLEQRLGGVSSSTLRSYFQPSYKKMRPLHLVAAYSWLTMMPMACFYRGAIIKAAYPDMDEASLKCLIHSGLLPTNQFTVMTSHLYNYLNDEQQHKVKEEIDAIEKLHGKLDDYQDRDFLFPSSINIQQFAYDYYYALAVGCQRIREENDIPLSVMARMVNLSPYRYERLEDTDNTVFLPVELGARLQLGFNLPNAMHFTVSMTAYPQFHTARRVQNIRQAILTAMIKHLNNKNKRYFSSMILNLSSMYLEPQK